MRGTVRTLVTAAATAATRGRVRDRTYTGHYAPPPPWYGTHLGCTFGGVRLDVVVPASIKR
jgi:hypothetical protein